MKIKRANFPSVKSLMSTEGKKREATDPFSHKRINKLFSQYFKSYSGIQEMSTTCLKLINEAQIF